MFLPTTQALTRIAARTMATESSLYLLQPHTAADHSRHRRGGRVLHRLHLRRLARKSPLHPLSQQREPFLLEVILHTHYEALCYV